MHISPTLPVGYSIHEQSDKTFVVQHPQGHFLVDAALNTRRFSNRKFAVNAACYDLKRSIKKEG